MVVMQPPEKAWYPDKTVMLNTTLPCNSLIRAMNSYLSVARRLGMQGMERVNIVVISV